MHLRPLFLSLLLTSCLSGTVHAAMLAPETDTNATANSAQPSSISSLKEKLDAARGKTAPAMPAPVALNDTGFDDVPSRDVTPKQPLPPVKEIIASAAQPVQQQVVRYDAAPAPLNAPINAPTTSASDIQNLLFDDIKPSGVSVPASPATRTHTAPAPMAAPVKAPIAVPPSISAPASASSQTNVTARPVQKSITPPVVADIPAVEIRKAPSATVSHFMPKPSNPVGDWKSRGMEATAPNKNDAICLLQNRFNNDLTLVIGRDSTGMGMVAVNYGIDVLAAPQEYDIRIQLDKVYDQNLPGYADNPDRIVATLEKSDAFFSALQSADALHVEMRGLASTFSLKNLSQGLQSFASCLAGFGGGPLPSAAAVAPAAPAPDMPQVPIPPVAAHDLNTPQAALDIPMPSGTATPGGPDVSWQYRTANILQNTGVMPQHMQQDGDTIHWSNGLDSMHGTVRTVVSTDSLEVASNAIDAQEKNCRGTFASQMGLPDENGMIQMESKCVIGNEVTVSTWLVTQKGNAATIWQMSSLRDARQWAFQARDKILSALKTFQE